MTAKLGTMCNILDDESYRIEDRFEMAKFMLEIKDLEIKQLTSKLDQDKFTRGWIQEDIL